MGFDVTGSVALVTGANRGIGKVIVESLVKHGAKQVYAAVRDPASAAPLTASLGGTVKVVELDLSKPATIEAAARHAKDVQLVINNAGVLRAADPFAADAFDALRYELDVNVIGLMHMARAFAPVLQSNGGGAFVQLNSVASLKSFPAFSTYCASKAAAYSITQALRELLAPNGTMVVSVHPGPIATDMAHSAGLGEIADPPEVVAEALIAGLKAGVFHVFPDKMARQFEEAYRGFAQGIIETPMTVG